MIYIFFCQPNKLQFINLENKFIQDERHFFSSDLHNELEDKMRKIYKLTEETQIDLCIKAIRQFIVINITFFNENGLISETWQVFEPLGADKV